MKTNLKYILIAFLAIILSCTDSKTKKTDFIGVWKSSDEAYIILKKNGTCTLKGIDYYKISSFPKNKNKKLNAEGTWQFTEDAESGIIDNINSGVYIKYELYDGGEGEIVFYISGQGINGNNPPWNIFIWDGDPDDMQKYEFTKVNK